VLAARVTAAQVGTAPASTIAHPSCVDHANTKSITIYFRALNMAPLPPGDTKSACKPKAMILEHQRVVKCVYGCNGCVYGCYSFICLSQPNSFHLSSGARCCANQAMLNAENVNRRVAWVPF